MHDSALHDAPPFSEHCLVCGAWFEEWLEECPFCTQARTFHDELPFADDDTPEPGERITEVDECWPEYADYTYSGPELL